VTSTAIQISTGAKAFLELNSHTLSKVAECGDRVTQSQYMSYNQGRVEEILINLVYTNILLATKDPIHWPYLASSWYLCTGHQKFE
jgi:hypothetical protein